MILKLLLKIAFHRFFYDTICSLERNRRNTTTNYTHFQKKKKTEKELKVPTISTTGQYLYAYKIGQILTLLSKLSSPNFINVLEHIQIQE